MKLFYALAGAAVVVGGGAVGLALWAGQPVASILMDAYPIAKALGIFLGMALVLITAWTAATLVSRSRASASMVAIFGGLAAGFGALGAAYSMLNMYAGINAVGHVPSLGVLAPSITEALMQLSLGLITAAVAAAPKAVLRDGAVAAA